MKAASSPEAIDQIAAHQPSRTCSMSPPESHALGLSTLDGLNDHCIRFVPCTWRPSVLTTLASPAQRLQNAPGIFKNLACRLPSDAEKSLAIRVVYIAFE